MFLALATETWTTERAAQSFQQVREFLTGDSRNRQRMLVTEALLMRARGFYNNPSLTYHNWQHIQAVIDAHEELWGPPEPEMLLALAYHDAVYVPGADPEVNEQLSWKAFYNCLVQEIGDPTLFEALDWRLVEKLILTTVVRNHVASELPPLYQYTDCLRMLDCDLVAMAAESYDVFVNTQNAVLSENVGQLWLSKPGELAQLRAKQAAFLAKFLERDYVYHTVEAREAWETRAQYNLSRFVDEWSLK